MPSPRPVGLGDDQFDVVGSAKARQGLGREIGGSHKDQAQVTHPNFSTTPPGRRLDQTGLLVQLPHCLPPILRGDAVQYEQAVKMIDLMLENTRLKVVQLDLYRRSVAVEIELHN